MDESLKKVLEPSRVLVLECTTKAEALEKLIDCLAASPQVKDRRALAEGIFHREELMSTGIGMGIGVPHVRLDSVEAPVMAVGICRNPISDYESLDGEPVRLIFMIAAGKGQHAEHIKLLANITSRLKDGRLREALMKTTDAGAFYRTLVQEGA